MLSFGSASMLWWALAAVIPFALHLWNRKPREIVPFAATKFLITATKRQSRRLKFQQWILLLVRVATLLLFALALAEPRWSFSPTTTAIELPTHHVFVVDDSYSMQAPSDNGTRLEEVKNHLLKKLQAAPASDLFSVITMGEPPEIVIAGPSYDRDEIQRSIRSLQVRPVAASPMSAVSLARRIMEDAQSVVGPPGAASKSYHVTIASDLAKNSWQEINPVEIDTEFANLQSIASWSILASKTAPIPRNLAISQFRSDQSAFYPGQPITGLMEIANTGLTPFRDVLVEIRDGDRVLYRDLISLDPGQQIVKRWSIDDVQDAVLLEARVDADDLSLDNQRFLAIEKRAAPRVLCVASSRVAAEHFLLALASGSPTSRPQVDLLEVGNLESSLGTTRLSPYDAVVLLNLSPPTADTARDLRAFVERGGGVLVGLGDRATGDSSSPVNTTDFLPASIGMMAKTDAPRLDPLGFQHPLLAAFRDAPEVGILSLPIWRYCKLESVRPTAKVAARFGSGDPALLEESVGRGTIVLFAGSLGAESIDKSENPATPWSGLPGSAAYVPLIHEWVMRVAAARPRPELLIGDAIPPLGQDAPVIEFRRTGNWNKVSPASTSLLQPGFYRLSGPTESSPFAANIDAKESWYQSDQARWSERINLEPEANARRVGGAVPSQSLSTWLLIPLVLLLCGEIILGTLLRRVKPRPALSARIAA